MQINVSYITANDIMKILEVGRSKAYEIVRVMNEELENAGYIQRSRERDEKGRI